MVILEKSKRFCEEFKKFTKHNSRFALKIAVLIDDIQRNPTSGIGKPERLKHKDIPTYSRRINNKDRLVYEYDENLETVKLISCCGHYEDK